MTVETTGGEEITAASADLRERVDAFLEEMGQLSRRYRLEILVGCTDDDGGLLCLEETPAYLPEDAIEYQYDTLNSQGAHDILFCVLTAQEKAEDEAQFVPHEGTQATT